MPTEYIHFTAKQKEAARKTDLVALLQSQGEHLKRSGKVIDLFGERRSNAADELLSFYGKTNNAEFATTM